MISISERLRPLSGHHAYGSAARPLGLNGTGLTYIGNLFKHRHTPYRLRDEGSNLELPKFNLKFKKNSFTNSLTKLCNSLPSQVLLSSDANDFRRKLQDCSFLEGVL